MDKNAKVFIVLSLVLFASLGYGALVVHINPKTVWDEVVLQNTPDWALVPVAVYRKSDVNIKGVNG